MGPVKSRAGRRTIFIPLSVGEMRLAWREECPASAAVLVFPIATGKPTPLNNFTRRAWEPLLKEAGVVTHRKVRDKLVGMPKYSPTPCGTISLPS